ncbi:ATP-binding cassette domain-containing protein [Paenarthrobacter sp. NPDC056912]|uniref:ATP-binding cassette domain-containing protein n=1 Tax=Paenarthrobacter sp. NPDC056912 TaxID=3345965 RepID=UPI00366A5590
MPIDGSLGQAEPQTKLSLHGVGHGFEANHFLFRNLNAEFPANSARGLRGPSGSGKSTLLSIIAGWEMPKEGHVERTGISTVRWVFQNPLGVPQRTALDHVALPYLATGLSRNHSEELAFERLADFGLQRSASKRFSLLSGGEAQRLMLARAVAGNPDLILVDEPTAQLDRATAGTVNSVLGGLAKSGAVVIVASHDQDTLDACSEVLDLTTLGAGSTAT